MSEFQIQVEEAVKAWMLPSSSQRGGNRRSVVGTDFENLVLVSNQRYEVMDLGIVTKNNTRLQVIAGHAVHVEKQTVDFNGYLKNVGFVAFDAKSHDCKESDYFRPDSRQLHQLAYMLRLQRMSQRQFCRAFYLVERRWLDDSKGQLLNKRCVYLVEDLEGLSRHGRYEWNDADLVREGPHGILFDYRQKLLDTASSSPSL